MKLRAPVHCTGFSHEGRVYHVDTNGLVEVEDHLAAQFLAHGFVLCAEAAVPRAMTSADTSPPDIETLSRRALFALLREKGVRVRLPITNAALREAARQATTSG